MRLRRSRKYRTAVHEAGHAVIGRVLGMTCGHVTIEPDADSSGHSITMDPWEMYAEYQRRGRYREFETLVHGRMMTFMAGALAEIEIYGACQGGDEDDERQVLYMAEDNARVPRLSDDWPTDRDRQIERLRSRAAHVVRRHRPKIERLAHVLIERRTLTAEEVDALLAMPA